MKVLHLWSIAVTTMFFGASSATEVKEPSSLLQRLLTNSLGYSNTVNSNYNDATAASLLIPRIMYTLSNDYDYILSHDPKNRHQVRRGAPTTRRKTKKHRGGNPSTSRKKLQRGRCGFGAPLSRIGANRIFGCASSVIDSRGASRRW